MKVDLNFELFDLDGKPTAVGGKIISSFLMSETKGDAEKLFDWALSFNKLEVVEMDSADLNKFKDLIKNTERLSVLAKGPIIKYLHTLK